jgi:hypothetical protein
MGVVVTKWNWVYSTFLSEQRDAVTEPRISCTSSESPVCWRDVPRDGRTKRGREGLAKWHNPLPPPPTLTDKNTVHPSSIWIVPVRMLTFNLKANRNYCHISYVRPYCSRQFASYSRKRHVAWRSKNVETKVQNPARLVLVLHIKIL